MNNHAGCRGRLRGCSYPNSAIVVTLPALKPATNTSNISASWSGIFFMLSIIFTGYYLGLVIYKKLLKKDVNILLSGLMGITILYLLSIIPKIGFIVALVYALAGMGIVIKLFAKDN